MCPEPGPDELHYVGVTNCKGCHPSEFAVYSQMKHTHATQALVDKGRQYDLDCVTCHVFAYDKLGGACRLDQIKEGVNANVQCKSCHGMGSAHMLAPGKLSVPEPHPGFSTCVRCHDPDNDNHFNHETFTTEYLPQIVKAGHQYR